MCYLYLMTGDPLEFLHNVEIFGEQRSSSFVVFPQVVYRYVFKVLPHVNYDYFPAVFTAWLEFVSAIMFGVLGGLGILASLGKLKKIKFRWSYSIYLVLGYLIPPLSGSFSSLPRYVLVLFPGFIMAAIYLTKATKAIQLVTFALLFICLAIASSLFFRGYWVS